MRRALRLLFARDEALLQRDLGRVALRLELILLGVVLLR